MKKSVAVLGLGQFGLALVEELSKMDVEIIAVDLDGENVAKAGEFVNSAFICDSTNASALKELGINNVDHAVVSFGTNFQASLITTITLKEMNIPKITVRIDEDKYERVMRLIGATDIIIPQQMAGVRLANKIASDTFADYYNLSKDYVIVDIKVNENAEPRTLKEIDSRNRFGVNLVLINRDNRVFPPTGNDSVLPNDDIYIFGKKEKVTKFEDFINK